MQRRPDRVVSLGDHRGGRGWVGSRSRPRCGRRFFTARASGATLKEAAEAAGISKTAGHYWLAQSGGVRPRARRPRPALRLARGTGDDLARTGAEEDAHGHRRPAGPRCVNDLPRGDTQQRPERISRGARRPVRHRAHGPGHGSASLRIIRGCASTSRTSSPGVGRRGRSVNGSRRSTRTTRRWGLARDDLHLAVRNPRRCCGPN